MSNGDDTRSTLGTADRDELRGLLGMQTRRRPAVLAEGQVLGDAYRVVRELGAGGMGVVYLARDTRLQRDVAIKVHATVAGERLLREAAALAQLVHGNVVTVHEIGSWNDHPYVVMEYVPGGTARTWVAKGRSVRDLVSLYLAAGRGLAAAHAAGLVHRDFKPDNVLVGDDGRVRVADFGLARAHGEAGEVSDAVGEITRTGAVMGTPAYMAPEQKAGGPIGPAADQYAFAVSLWEALSGKRPPEGAPPRNVVAILRRALSERPEDRWPSMDALLAELARAVRPSRAPWIAAAVGALALAAGGTWLAVSRSQPEACAGAAGALGDAWSPAHRDAIHAAFGATGRPYADASFASVAGALDRYVAGWNGQRLDACRATNVRREETPELLALRDDCLDRRRDALVETIALLEHADADGVDHALDAVLALPDVAACADSARLAGIAPPPSDPARKADRDRAETELAAARALHEAGRFADGLAKAKDAVASADASGDADAGAATRDVLASLLEEKGDYPGGRAACEEGARLAATAHDDVLDAQLWIHDLEIVTVRLDQAQEAERFRRVAEAAVARAGDAPELTAQLALAESELANAEGKYGDAKDALTRTIAAIEAQHGTDDPRLGRALIALAHAQTRMSDFDGAHAALARAEPLVVSAYGADHPRVLEVRDAIADLDMHESKFADALAVDQEVLAATERLYGEDSVQVAAALGNLAGALGELDKTADARAAHERARAIYAAKLGPESAQVGQALEQLGGDDEFLGNFTQSADELAHAIAIQQRALGPDNPRVAETLRRLAQAKRELGDLPGSIAAFEQALDLLARAGQAKSRDAAIVEYTLAGALSEQGKQDEALVRYRHAAAVTEELLGAESPDTGHMYFGLAAQLDEMGRHQEARAELELARPSFGKDPDSADAAVIDLEAAEIDVALGDLAKARLECDHGFAIWEKTYGPDHIALAEPLLIRSTISLALHDDAAALADARRLVELRAKSEQKDPAGDAAAFFQLAQAEWATGDRAAAITDATRAKASFAAAGDPHQREVAAWLAHHRK